MSSTRESYSAASDQEFSHAKVSHLEEETSGRRFLVTGAASGIGRETATLLGLQGSRVVVVDRNLERVSAVSDDINAAGGEAVALVADIANEVEVERMIA